MARVTRSVTTKTATLTTETVGVLKAVVLLGWVIASVTLRVTKLIATMTVQTAPQTVRQIAQALC